MAPAIWSNSKMFDMQIGIATQSQREGLVTLLGELHSFYNETPSASRADIASHLDSNLCGPSSPVTLVVADDPEAGVVGLAALVLLPSVVEATTDARRQCNLKELFVSARSRGAGIGEALVRWSARFALEAGCGRMDWHVEAGNASSIRFYERLGGARVEDRLNYRLARSRMVALAAAPGEGEGRGRGWPVGQGTGP